MVSHILVEAIGAGAALCSIASFVPQLAKLIRERSAQAVSTRMFVLTVAAFSLWAVYGLMLRSWPLVVSNLLSLALSGAILLVTLRLRARDGARDRPAPR
jgi:MtN3 and saliva related transmembrane protein